MNIYFEHDNIRVSVFKFDIIKKITVFGSKKYKETFKEKCLEL